MLTTIITVILVVGLFAALGYTTNKISSLEDTIDSLLGENQTLHQEKEMIDATRQLLRNEVIVLNAQIRAMEGKSMHAIIDVPKTEETKPKKKKYFKKKAAPKMSADKK
jgi:hypothetical protein